MKQINIGLLGFGTVGTGVAKILIENRDMIASRIGATLNLKRIADIDVTSRRDIELEKGMLIPDARAVIHDPEIDIIVEMIGGRTVAKQFILDAIENGKHIVTANKALLADGGDEVIAAARAKGVDLAYEASVGGCMPIIKSLRESLVGNRIESMVGILNGTCNYILSKISQDGSSFREALAEAQENGFAEADPTLDVEGMDTAHKLAILTALAFGTGINLKDIFVEGISSISPQDIDFAREFGYCIKLLAIGKDMGDALEARVHPTMIPFSNPLSNISGSLNAVTISGDCVGDMMLYGRGAGMMPTASAVVGDIADIARNIITGSCGRIPVLGFQADRIKDKPVLPIDELVTHYYFRFAAKDQPKVLSKISGILGDHHISIKSVHQKGRETSGSVPIVMLTHLAREIEVYKALNEIQALDVVTGKTVLIRIEDQNYND
ncbi:MAG: homoserine dehydrogenase [Proteobacteria bacterium]|nr:homoserine dehydrogenase [Pseudomonadota bacterium]MBU4470829.1 homoserine dehydrogenase [Pseudomonadota bacterium]MCG2750973.1 homoserine dehydrogenase [Desulfobacteraceae bacterium]